MAGGTPRSPAPTAPSGVRYAALAASSQKKRKTLRSVSPPFLLNPHGKPGLPAPEGGISGSCRSPFDTFSAPRRTGPGTVSMLQASMLTQPVVAVATGNRRRQQSGAAGPPVPASPAPTRRPSSLRGLTGQPSLRKDGATSQQAVATAEAAPVETTVPLAGMGLSDMSNAGETLREQLERRFKLEFAEPDEGSSTPKKVFIRRRSTAAQASSTQQKPREPSPVPQRAAGSPSPSGRTEQKRAQTTRARAAGATGASTGSQPSRSRRERESLPVLVRGLWTVQVDFPG